MKRWTVAGVVTMLVALAGMWPAAARAAEGQVTVMIPGTLLSESWEQAVAAFTKRTGIEVDVVVAASWEEMMQKVPVMVAGGVAPDALYHDSGVQADLVNNGSVRPLDEFIARENFDLSIWPQPVLAGYMYRGQLYGLPTGISNFTWYYNADKLAAAGIGELPTDWENMVDFTFDDMVQIARKVTVDQDGDGVPEQYGLQNFGNFGAQALNMWRLDYINEDQTAFIATSEAHIEAIMQMRSLWVEHGVVGGNFLDGSAVMLQIQPYFLNTLSSQMQSGGFFAWKNAVNPLAVCRCSLAAFHSWGMPRGSQNPDAGWEIIKFMAADPEGAILFSRAENRVPVLRESIEEFVDRWERINPGQNARVLTDSLNHVTRSNSGGLPRSVWNTWYPMMQRIMRGEVDPLTGMRQIEPVINGILAEFHRR